MSYTFELEVGMRDVRSEICFHTLGEARDFGQIMFEPPQSVVSWNIVEDYGRANFSFTEGKLRAI